MRNLWVGIGCSRGISKEFLEQALEQVCQEHFLLIGAIAGLATIELKSDEVGLLEYCRAKQILFKTFTAEALSLVEVPNPSLVVDQKAKTPSVAEAAAILGAGGNLLVTKQIIKGDGGTVTVALARAEKAYTGSSKP